MSKPCTPNEARPTYPGTRIARSKVGRWRALVLVLVTALMIAHFVQWKLHGTTLTPVEPSEGMAWSKDGVVNAGLVFFLVMIGSTLVLGRWFCGWACHVVALQDGARWLLHKLRLRPRHVDLGVLGWVPWLACVYMFLQLVAERLLTGVGLAPTRAHFMTENFWATFPNWITALLTFAVVGFAIVWFLGAKGFCAYGCPYGGVFGVVDQAAPVRIRVTDDCSGCGHCTAVCTSNVKVHAEVRDFKAVVDPACMKCLDCVSVCPNDALYVGFGMPALLSKRRTPVEPKKKVGPSAAVLVGRALLLAAFFFAAISTFLASNPGASDFDLSTALVLTAFAGVVALPFRGRPARARRDYALGEEVLLAAAFLVAMFGLRGQHVPVGLPGAETIDFPFLFAMGIAAIFAYAVVQLVRMATRANLSLSTVTLRASGRVVPAGVAFASLALPIVALVGWRAWVHVDLVLEQHARSADVAHDDETMHRVQELYQRGMQAAAANDLRGAERAFRDALELAPEFVPARENLAGMLCAQNRFAEGVEQYRIALRTNEKDPDTHAFLAQALTGLADFASARKELERAIELAPENADLHAFLADVCARLGDSACSAEHARRAGEISKPR